MDARKTKMMRALLSLGLGMACVVSTATDRKAAFEMNRRLGRGINIGNTFEASPNENSWGNPWNPEYLKMIGELGFNHVRLPVNWDMEARAMQSAPYTIKPEFLDRIKGIVDEAIRNKLIIIVNMHHHHKLLHGNPDANKDRFLSQWEQIAEAFKDHPDGLIFEVMNEPQGKLTGAKWGEFFNLALSKIRQSNPKRIVLLSAPTDGQTGVEVPDDPYLIFTPHLYIPFFFTHQSASWEKGSSAWQGTKWYDTAYEREQITNYVDGLVEFGKRNNIPEHIGEFGTIGNADMQSRARWTTFVARLFEKNKFSWAYWEFSSLFGIYDPAAKTYRQELVDALIKNPMPAPRTAKLETLYESDFSKGSQGWHFNVNSGAKAENTTRDGAMVLNITNPGKSGWNVQLKKGRYPLKQGELYMVKFSAKDTSGRKIISYVGNPPAPWSHYNNCQLTDAAKDISYCFSMGKKDDAESILTLDIGGGKPSEFTIEKIGLYRVVLE